jgi:hypothetical protein
MLYSAKVDGVAKPVVAATEKPKRVQSEKQIAALAKAQEARKMKLIAAKESGIVPEKKVRVVKKSAEVPAAVAVPVEDKTPSEQGSETPTLVETAPEIVPKVLEKIVEEEKNESMAPVVVVKGEGKGKGKGKRVADSEGDDHEPPAWFKTFIKNARKEEAKVAKGDKKPVKQVEAEASKFAQQQWQDGYTRDRINHQADQHLKKMHQMYSQMFYRA